LRSRTLAISSVIDAILILGLSLGVLWTGCVVTPPERRDIFPAAASDQAYKNITLALLFSDNTKNAIQYAQDYVRTKSSMAGGGARDAALAPAVTVFEDILAVLRGSFKTVIKIERIEDVEALSVDAVAVLDVYARFPNFHGDEARIDITAVFSKRDQTQIDVVKADSVTPSPNFFNIPARENMLRTATEDIIVKWKTALRDSVKLADFSKSRSDVTTAVAALPQALPPKIAVGASDVDSLPVGKMLRRHGYAVVIGIQQYREKLPKADFADRDAKLVAEYLTKVLGYPEENVVVRLNDRAAKADLEKYFESWLPNNVEKDSTVFVYYSGHGTPNTKNGEAYLVPYDGDPTFIDKTGYSLKRLYEQLDKLPAKEVIVMLDSCFSGQGGRSVLAKGAKPMVLSMENSIAGTGKSVVLAASGGDQISTAYEEKGHGLLTYFFLKGLQGEGDTNKDGVIELEELYRYVKPQVQRIARKQYNTEQTPQLLASQDAVRKGPVRLLETK
jgi:hypothetical protein